MADIEMSLAARAARAAYFREYQRKNREKLTAYHKAWRQKNREKVLVKEKQYREEHREQFARYRRDYWERKAARAIQSLGAQGGESNSERGA